MELTVPALAAHVAVCVPIFAGPASDYDSGVVVLVVIVLVVVLLVAVVRVFVVLVFVVDVVGTVVAVVLVVTSSIE